MDLSAQKHQVLRQLLPLCPYVRIHVHTSGIKVPAMFKEAETVVFRVGEDPRALGIPDLVLNDWGWRGTLSFRGAQYFCEIPWAACDLFYFGEPFVGPVVQWPHVAVKHTLEPEVPAEKPRPARGGLRLVK